MKPPANLKYDFANVVREIARREMGGFITYTKPDYQMNWHHELICEYVDKFIRKEIQKLLIFAPPQHGKSEITTRRTPAKILGNNPETKVAVVSYSAGLAKSFNKDIQRIIDDERYHELFPNTTLASSQVAAKIDGFTRNAVEFEIVGHRGGCRTVGVDGPLTGFPVDIGIFDDLYKSRFDAMSRKRGSLIMDFWKSVFIPRLHNDSQILGTFTRWAPNDHGAYLMKNEKDWTVLEIPAIRTKRTYIYHDPRKEGQALWPAKHSLPRLVDIKRSSPTEFDALYQQNPQAPRDLLVITNWDTVKELPGVNKAFLGMDFGFTKGPTALVQCELIKGKFDEKIDIGGGKFEIKTYLGKLFVHELCYDKGMTNDKIKALFVKHGIVKSRTWGDSEDMKTITELQQMGLGILPASKGPGSVKRGVAKLSDYKLYITASSHNIISNANNYQYVAVGGEITNEILKNGNEHAIDAIRYAFEGYTTPQMK